MNKEQLDAAAKRIMDWADNHHRAVLGIACFIAGFVAHLLLSH